MKDSYKTMKDEFLESLAREIRKKECNNGNLLLWQLKIRIL